jgi:hypothetical protein
MNLNCCNIIGFFSITLGLVIFFFAAGELILRLLIALFGLYIVNYGMRLRGMQPIHWTIMRLWSNRYNF